MLGSFLMNRYIKLLKLIWNGVCIGYCLWKEEEIFEPTLCEYCGETCSKNICTLCNREQPKFKLYFDIETRRKYYIDAWDIRLEKTRNGNLR